MYLSSALKIYRSTLNSTLSEVAFNEKSAVMKENLRTKYFSFTYNDVTLNEKLPITKENLHIFFFGGVECIYILNMDPTKIPK